MKRPAGPALPLLTTLAAAAALTACGSSGSTSSSHASPGGGGGLSTSARSAHLTRHDCPALVAGTLGTVARRIYDAARHGNVVGQAVHRVETSKVLADAVSANDASAAHAALRSLLAGQIVGIQVLKSGKVFAAMGSVTAIAPVRGPIAGTGAQFVLSTQAARSYLEVTRQVTGAEVVLYEPGGRLAGTTAGPPVASVRHDRSIVYRGHRYQVTSIAATRYPSGILRIALLVPLARGAACGASAEQAAAETLGHVGERIYHEEADSPYVRATLRHIEADRGFQQAVAARDTTAIRAAIVRFFGEHIHVVRVRVYGATPSGAQRFLYDLGGPYVLAPVHGVVRSGGRIVGKFSYAIQDDAGYLRLAHLFTGAEILMRTGGRQVMGTLDPGPTQVPRRGTVGYRGKRYAAYSFTGEAFPSGPLEISLLLPSDGGAGD
ncbi:MAG TPA: hypothetical protein VL988_10080 [Solirubrobacteraceae bacterium]|nr:hypothetical protein [Solirubrobacteraceae bacterium]